MAAFTVSRSAAMSWNCSQPQSSYMRFLTKALPVKSGSAGYVTLPLYFLQYSRNSSADAGASGVTALSLYSTICAFP